MKYQTQFGIPKLTLALQIHASICHWNVSVIFETNRLKSWIRIPNNLNLWATRALGSPRMSNLPTQHSLVHDQIEIARDMFIFALSYI